MKNDIPLELPQEYNISLFPEHIDFIIPGFEKVYPPGRSKTLALKKRDCKEWYDEFVDKVIAACGKQFLPICRMSDGEFHFLLGEQPFDKRVPLLIRLRLKLSNIKENFILKGGVGPRTAGHYHSGQYSVDEWRMARIELPEMMREISEKGIIAWHLNYEREPFAERYHPALDQWLKENKISVNDNSYYPFYFVYAMLIGPRRSELFKNRRVLVVNGAEGETKQNIIDGLKREGVLEVLWCPISLKRSLYDTIDVEPFIGKVDFAVVGAGIGKANIMVQMEALNVPCIDAGFIFEVWKDPQNRGVRSFSACDDDLK